MNTVQTILENEVIVFGLFGLMVVGMCLWFGYILRRWSWMPRKEHKRMFVERF